MRSACSYAIALVALSLIGLDGVAMADEAVEADAGRDYLAKGQLILVKEFTTEGAQVKGDNSEDAVKVAAKKERVPRKLANQIVEQLRARGFAAAPYAADSETAGAFILDGEITLIHNGSGVARAFISLGAGKAKMAGSVELFSAADPSEKIASKKIRAASVGIEGIFGGQRNRENAVNYNFARKVASLLVDTEVAARK